MWMMSRPRDEGRTVQMEMWNLVGLLSDTEANLRLISKLKTGLKEEAALYKKTMCGGLLSCSAEEHPDMAFAGISASNARFEFSAFKKFGGIFGELEVYPAPSTYLMEDRAMLYSVIQHELRHFMDFLDNGRRPIETDYWLSGSYRIDLDKYSRNITEMRAHADQAAALLRIMGGAENAKKAIRQSQIGMSMVSEMNNAMMLFIDMLEEENIVKEFVEPPAAVARSEDHDVRTLVGHLQRMFEVMRLSNSLKAKS